MEDREMMQEFNKLADSIPLPEELSEEKMMKKLASTYYNKEAKKQRNKRNILRGTYISLGAIAVAALIFIICLNTVGVMGVVYKDGEFGMSQHVFSTRKDDNGFLSLRSLYNVETFFVTNGLVCKLNDMGNRVTGSFEIGASGEAPGYSSSLGNSWSDSTYYDYVGTEVRTDGVAEGDVVVTNGKYIFSYGDVHRSKYKKVQIISAEGESSEVIGVITIRDYIDEDFTVREMYICDDLLVVMCETQKEWGKTDAIVWALFMDVSDGANPKHLSTYTVDGAYKSSRIVEGYLYIFSTITYNKSSEGFKPKINGKAIKNENIYLGNISYEARVNPMINYDIITSVSLKEPQKEVSTVAVLSNCYQNYYVSTEGIYMYYDVPRVLSVCWCHNSMYSSKDEGKTFIMKFLYDKGKITTGGKVTLDGEIDDSFCIDEYDGYLRVVTTVDSSSSASTSVLYILDDKFNITGKIEDIAEGEVTSSALFLGDIGYFVTHENRVIDPLFSVDLSDPKNPQILGSLELPGYTDYMRKWSDDLLLGFGFTGESEYTAEYNKLSLFDVSDPLNLKEISVVYGEGEEVVYDMNPENYKSKLISPEKNIIGFYCTAAKWEQSQTTNEYERKDMAKYYIYSIENNQLLLKNVVELPAYSAYFSVYAAHTRGICIGDYVYITVPGYMMYVYDIEQNQVIEEINIGL